MSTLLTHSPADVIRWLLINNGQGSDPDLGQAWPIYASSEPTGPDNCLTVYDLQGTEDGREHHGGEILEHPGWQVRVRAQDHRTGWTKLNAVRVWMSETACMEVVTIEGTADLVWAFTRIGNVIPLGTDVAKTKRHLFTLNGTVPIQQQ